MGASDAVHPSDPTLPANKKKAEAVPALLN
jgi:hypothetical protein